MKIIKNIINLLALLVVLFAVIWSLLMIAGLIYWGFNYLTTEYYFVRTQSCGYVVYAKTPGLAAQYVLDKGCKGLTEVKEI